MVSKTISVTEEVYMLLKRMKLPHESFGETIERLCKNFTTENLLKWYENTDGWKDMTNEEFHEIDEVITDFGKNFKPQKAD
ncbi:MAG: antitoxin VapB family protein [Promethearchaeota archaeon]